MKIPKSLKECKNDDEIEAYIRANDGLGDHDLDDLEPVELGPEDRPENIVPVVFDAPTLARMQKLAKRKGKLLSTLIREWADEGSRRESSKAAAMPKKRARG